MCGHVGSLLLLSLSSVHGSRFSEINNPKDETVTTSRYCEIKDWFLKHASCSQSVEQNHR